MGIVIDLVIIAIVVLSTFLGYKKGLAALAIKLCAVIIAVLVTLILYKPISNLIVNTTGIDETIQNAIYEKAMETVNSGEETSGFLDTVVNDTKTGVIEKTARELSIQIINVCVIVILYFGIKFALRFVTAIANKVAKLPIINQFNKAGGIVFGLVRGLAIVYACLLLIGFAGQINSNNFMHENVEKSTIGKMMYENNVFNILL